MSFYLISFISDDINRISVLRNKINYKINYKIILAYIAEHFSLGSTLNLT